MDRDIYAALIAAFLVGMVFGVIAGKYDGKCAMRESAIKANVAEWQVDSMTGETQFVWRRP